MRVNSDFKERLSILNGNGVKYLVIGGYAVIEYAPESSFSSVN